MIKNVLVGLLCLTFFNVGCTTAQRKELMDEVKTYAKENLVPEAKKYAEDYVNKKLQDLEDKKKAELDNQLAVFKFKDESGVETVKTWKDFDQDKDGTLSPKELLTVNSWVNDQRSKGNGTSDAAKGIGLTLLTLGGIWVSKKGVGVVLKKASPIQAPITPRV